MQPALHPMLLSIFSLCTFSSIPDATNMLDLEQPPSMQPVGLQQGSGTRLFPLPVVVLSDPSDLASTHRASQKTIQKALVALHRLLRSPKPVFNVLNNSSYCCIDYLQLQKLT